MRRKTTRRWNSEPFLRAACDQIVQEVDWDRLDSGCLHWTVSLATALPTNERVIVGVLSDMQMFNKVLAHAAEARKEEELPEDVPIWIYVPELARLPDRIPSVVVIKRVKGIV